MMQGDVQVSKRPMTDAERRAVDNVYRMTQKAARMVGGLAILFALFSVFMSSFTGTEVDAVVSIVLALILVLFAVVSLVLTYTTLKLRKTIGEVQRAGYVIAVRGPVTMSNGAKGKRSWSVGPLGMAETPVTVKVLREGAVTELVCVPKLRSVVSINGVGLEQAVAATVPAELEAMAASA